MYNNNREIIMKLQQIIRDYQAKTGMNESEIARKLNIASSTVNRWASGDVQSLSKAKMEKLSELVGYNIEPILKGMDITIRLPVLGYVKAGYDLFAEENYLGEEEVSLADSKKGDYFLQIQGNSMSGIGIMDNSYVLVRQTDHVASGTVAIVMVGDEVTVKKVIYKNNMMILEAANPEVENRYFTMNEIKELPVRVIGQVLSCKTYF